jgi:hypothetical protein
MPSWIPYWSIILSIGLVGISVFMLVVFSARNLAYGKVETLSLVIFAVPLVIAIVTGLVMDTWGDAAIMALVVTFGLTLLGLVGSGIRSIFSSDFTT